MPRKGKKPNYLSDAATTPQSHPLPGQSQNNAGGYSFALDCWQRLDQFLILGTEGGTFYVKEKELTLENVEEVRNCIAQDGIRVVKRVVEISESGRAPKNDPAIFVLALVASSDKSECRKSAMEALPKVCRTGTHLFHFAQYIQKQRGWGRGLRHGIGKWYLQKELPQLVYQVMKYQNRDGWSHRDLLRLAHIKPTNSDYDILFRWITQKNTPETWPESLRQLEAFTKIFTATTQSEICEAISRYALPREAIPTQWLNRPETWECLLEKMPTTALIRNLANMTRCGLLTEDSAATKKVLARLQDENSLRKARIHPIQALSALLTYKAGRGLRGKNTWTPVTSIYQALDSMFYMTFPNVTPTNKRILLALDVSGSMAIGSIGGVIGLSPRVASAALALVTANIESNYMMMGFSEQFVPVPILPKMQLDQVIKTISSIEMGSTDCSLPMIWAMKKEQKIDAFVIYTDNETWYGKIHPCKALEEYRRKMQIDSQLIVVGMTSNGFSIADPKDPNSLDIVGFDTAVPQLLNNFISRKLYSVESKNTESNQNLNEEDSGQDI